MNANPMEEQIGRLVGNLLAGGGEIFLPGVGSLYTERQGARRLNRRTVLPPSRTVAFTSQQRGVSLVDEIARVMREAGGYENPEAEAQAVYDRWIARVHRADLLTVEGVGELKFKNFIPDEAFDLRLNPQGREPVRVRVQRRFDWPLWVGIAAIGIAAVYGGREFLLLYPEAPEAAAVTEIPAASDSFGTVEAPDALVEAPPTERSVAGVSAAQAGGRGFGGFRSRRSPGTGDRRNASGAGAGRPDGVAFGPPLCRAGGFQHRRERPARRAGDRGQGVGAPLPDLPFRGEIHGFALLVGRCRSLCAVHPRAGRAFPRHVDLHRPLMALAELIIRAIDWFYIRPVAAVLPRQVFRYAVCGGVTYILFDPVCYFLFYNFIVAHRYVDLGFVVVSPHIAAMILVFPFTFFVGFWLNRYVAFRRSPIGAGTQLLRYLLSVAGSVLLTYAGLKFFVEVCGVWPTPAKMVTTLLTTVYSFLAAKYFTFRHAEKPE